MSDLPSKSIEIDEEGYPVFSGIRADEESILNEYVSNLKRQIQGENKFPLVSKCGGVNVWVNAFDCPLVAQSVEAIDRRSSYWVMPGGSKSFEVMHCDLYVDRWDRLHTFIGEDEIPAVMTRKAQSAFLLEVDVEVLNLKPYWPTEKDVSTSKRWNNAYKDEEQQGWEMWKVNPLLPHYGIQDLVDKKATVLVPGAGRGHDAQWISKRGCKTTALDFSNTAQSEFRKLYPNSLVDYQNADIFSYLKDCPESFDAVFEHTIFCAISPSRKVEYLDLVHSCLKPGGIYFGAFFVLSWIGGPPFGLTQWELRELIKGKFNIKQWEVASNSHPRRHRRELWAVLEKA